MTFALSADINASCLGKLPGPLSIIPYSQDPHFTGREDIMNSIKSNFETEHRVALTGVGGVGYVASTFQLNRLLTHLHPAESHR